MTTEASSKITSKPTAVTEAASGLIEKTPMTPQSDYVSTRWFEKRNGHANRFVLQLRRHVEDHSLSLARLLRSATIKTSACWFDANR